MKGRLIYSFVARGKVVLAAYSSFRGNFRSIAQQCLEKIPPGNSKLTFPHGKHTLNFLLNGGFVYLLLAEQEVPRAVVFGFLEKVKDEFSSKHAAKAANLPAHALDKAFGPRLKDLMTLIQEHPEEVDKTAKIKSQVADVKKVMKGNIDKAMKRGEKMEILNEKAADLESQANIFKKKSEDIKNMELLKNMWMKLAVGGLFVLIALAALAPLLKLVIP